jgi:hypothetical protein
MKTLIPISCVLALAAGVCAYASDVRTPVLGYVPGAAEGALIRLDGIPGAAQARPVAVSGAVARWLAVSPEHNYAAGIHAEDNSIVIVRPGSEQPALRTLGSFSDGNISLSQNGNIAAVFSGHSVQIFGGLPERPVHLRTVSIAALQNSVQSLAVSDDGAVIAASDGTGDLLIATEHGFRIAGLPAPVAAITFRPGRQEAVIVAGREVFRLNSASFDSQPELLAGPEQGLEAPASAEFSRDGNRIYIADPGLRSIHVLESDVAGKAAAVACDCSPAGLRRLRGQAVFWLNDPSADVVRIFDGDRAEAPRVLLVPQTPVSN